MSIAVGQTTGEQLAIWLAWLGLAILAALFTGLLRPAAGRGESLIHSDEGTHIARLAGIAFLTLGIWVLVQIVFQLITRVLADHVNGTVHTSSWYDAALKGASFLSGLGFALLLLRRPNSFELIGLTTGRLGRGILQGMFFILLVLPTVYVTLNGTNWLIHRFTTYDEPVHEMLVALRTQQAIWVRVVIILTVVVVAPIFEELLFRGLIQTVFRRVTGSAVVAVIVSSALFSLIHEPWSIAPIFVFAIFLGTVYARTGNLWASITMHALFNAFAIVLAKF